MKECVIRLAIHPSWWATGGLKPWTTDRRRAFVFTTTTTGPYANAVDWARAHADHLRKHLFGSKRDRVQIEGTESR